MPLALIAAVIGGGRVVYLALAALFEGSIGADIALAIACVAAACLGEYFVAAEVVFIALVGECLEALTFERRSARDRPPHRILSQDCIARDSGRRRGRGPGRTSWPSATRRRPARASGSASTVRCFAAVPPSIRPC